MDYQKKRTDTMRYSIIDGSLYVVMSQAGVSFLTPFAIAINAPILIISALNAVPPFLDGIAQKIGAYFSDFGWKRKKILVWGGVIQSLMWLFLALLAYFTKPLGPELVNTGLVLITILIYFFGGIANPAWVALMGDVVPEKIRASWFGYRNSITQLVGLSVLLFAGFFLDSMKTDVFVGFAILFVIAFLSRLIGACFLELHWDPKPHARKELEVRKEAYKYSLILFLIFFVINISGAYLTVYLLDILKFDYISFSAALISFIILYVLAAPHWGRLIEKYGTKKVLISSITIISLPSFVFVFVYTPIQAILAWAFVGMIWAGVTISYFNYLYEITKPEERIKASGHAYLFLGAGTFFGTMVGGFLLSFLGAKSILSFHILFVIAGLLRIVVAFIVNANIREVKTPPRNKGTIELMANIITIYPFKGLMYDFRNLIKRTNGKK